MTPKQMARIGVFHIEEAILDPLFLADDEYVRAVDIARKIGIKLWDPEEWVVSAILYKLEEDEPVEARRGAGGQRSGWKLTTREKKRRADIET